MNIIDIVKDQYANFIFYRDGNLWYETEKGFKFPVPVTDIGNATFNDTEKAIHLMRYIRPHLKTIEEAKA